ncbi:transcriptional regulator [Pseudonocardia sichuanensis]
MGSQNRSQQDVPAASQHLSVLEKAGLVEIDKGYEGRRARTWIHLTTAGKIALHDEISQLKLLIREVEEHPGPTSNQTS